MSMAPCVAKGRLAPANGRNPGRQDRRAAPVCSFVVPKMGPKTGPKKWGRNIAGRRKRLPKWRPRFWDQGVAYIVSPLLRAVSSGDSGNLSFVFLAMGLTKPHPSFTVYQLNQLDQLYQLNQLNQLHQPYQLYQLYKFYINYIYYINYIDDINSIYYINFINYIN